MAPSEERVEAEKRKALTLAITQIEKQLGKGSIMRMGSDSPREKIAAIPHIDTEVLAKLAPELSNIANFPKFEFIRLIAKNPGRGITPPPPPASSPGSR